MFLSTTLLLFSLAAPMQQNKVILQPDAILSQDGSLLEGQSVVIQNGRIVEISASPTAQGMTVKLSGVLAPGMIDAFSGRGADRLITEQSSRTTPDIHAADGVQFSSPVWDSLLARGVTAVHIVPDPTNVIAGWGVLVSCGGANPKERVLKAETSMVGSLVDSSVSDSRVGPSSLAGALELLEKVLTQQKAQQNKDSLWLFLENAEGARGATAMAKRLDTQYEHAILMGELGEYGGAFADQLVGVPAMGLGGLARRVETWRRMHKAGARFAFGTRAGNREWDSLRTSAMAFSRFTGDAQAAWSTVTSNPAEMLGMENEIGSIRVGARADLVLWSAHPLNATARVAAVMVGGETVYRNAMEVQ